MTTRNNCLNCGLTPESIIGLCRKCYNLKDKIEQKERRLAYKRHLYNTVQKLDPVYKARRKQKRLRTNRNKLPIRKKCIICLKEKVLKSWIGDKCHACYDSIMGRKSIENLRERSKSPKNRFSFLVKRAAKSKLAMELDLNDYINLTKDNKCYYCSGTLPLFGAGIDRLDCLKGYVLNNVVACCKACNRIKGDNLTPLEMLEVAKLLKSLRGSDTLAINEVILLEELGYESLPDNTVRN